MISDATIRTIHEAARTDRLYAVTRRDGFTWIMQGTSIDLVEAEAAGIWNQKPLSITPIMGVLPTPKVS